MIDEPGIVWSDQPITVPTIAAVMKDLSILSDNEIDVLLLSHVNENWQKVAMVISKAMISYHTWDPDRVGRRIITLVDTGKLDSAGDIRNWRFSEIRLPA
jgi:hypothetical protein